MAELEQGENNVSDSQQLGRRIEGEQSGVIDLVNSIGVPAIKTQPQSAGPGKQISLTLAPDSQPSIPTLINRVTEVVHSEPKEEAPVYPTVIQPVEGTVPGQELPLPEHILQQGKGSSSGSGPAFEIIGEETAPSTGSEKGSSSGSGPAFQILGQETAPSTGSGQGSSSGSGPAFQILGQENAPSTGSDPPMAADVRPPLPEQPLTRAVQPTHYERNSVSPPRIDYDQNLPIFGGVGPPTRATSSRSVVRVEKGKFPKYKQLSRNKGYFIYTTNEFQTETPYPYPTEIRLDNFLGKGGNGTVFKFHIAGHPYAVKLTKYRQRELSLLSQLDHPHITELLGVMIGVIPRINLPENLCQRLHLPHKDPCFLFMPLVDGNLDTLLKEFGPIKNIIGQDHQEGTLVLGNLMIILKQFLSGLLYLHKQNICHRDLKASNLLVEILCQCPDILHCSCNGQGFIIKISDFDGAKKCAIRRPDRFSAQNRLVENRDLRYTTYGYRAPELTHPNYYMEGTWADVWAVGVIILKLILSRDDNIAQDDVKLLTKSIGLYPHDKEALVATLQLKSLWKCATKDHRFETIAELAEDCLTITCAPRPGVKELLEKYFPTRST